MPSDCFCNPWLCRPKHKMSAAEQAAEFIGNDLNGLSACMASYLIVESLGGFAVLAKANAGPAEVCCQAPCAGPGKGTPGHNALYGYMRMPDGSVLCPHHCKAQQDAGGATGATVRPVLARRSFTQSAADPADPADPVDPADQARWCV